MALSIFIVFDVYLFPTTKNLGSVLNNYGIETEACYKRAFQKNLFFSTYKSFWIFSLKNNMRFLLCLILAFSPPRVFIS